MALKFLQDTSPADQLHIPVVTDRESFIELVELGCVRPGACGAEYLARTIYRTWRQLPLTTGYWRALLWLCITASNNIYCHGKYCKSLPEVAIDAHNTPRNADLSSNAYRFVTTLITEDNIHRRVF
jgi:hypothetical protein